MRKRQAARVGAQFIKHVVPAVVKPARTLWNEVIGFLFLSFAGIFGFHAVRHAVRGDMPRMALLAVGTLIMAAYGIHSFLRARKISRS